MPVRSLRSSVMRWPAKPEVDAAARAWAARLAAADPRVRAVGYIGSYARGDAGPGSDLDLVVLLTDRADPPTGARPAWATERLPVPADVILYTLGEWDRLPHSQPRLAGVVRAETVWVWPEAPSSSPCRGAAKRP